MRISKRLATRLPYYQRTHPSMLIHSKREATSALVDSLLARLPAEPKTVHTLSLPGPWWNFERVLQKRAFRNGIGRNFSFVCCEKERLIFDHACHRMPNKRFAEGRTTRQKFFAELDNADVMTNGRNICLIHCDVFEFVENTQKRFEIAFWDLNGPITGKMIEAIDKHIAGVIVPAGLFCVAFQAARESLATQKLMYPYRTRQAFLTDWIETCGFKFINSWAWNDGSPMFMMLFQRSLGVSQGEPAGGVQ